MNNGDRLEVYGEKNKLCDNNPWFFTTLRNGDMLACDSYSRYRNEVAKKLNGRKTHVTRATLRGADLLKLVEKHNVYIEWIP